VRALWPAATQAQLDEATTRFNARVLGTGERVVLESPKTSVFALSEWLIGQGAARVAVAEADYVFSASNPFIERLERRIG
jgi:hypothetical protein